jgi:hypothetical protein
MANTRYAEPSNARTMREEMGLAEQAAFLNSVLESSTEYSIVAKDLEGRIHDEARQTGKWSEVPTDG